MGREGGCSLDSITPVQGYEGRGEPHHAYVRKEIVSLKYFLLSALIHFEVQSLKVVTEKMR